MFYAMGGSWRDADGSTFDPVSFAALERRDDVGFRCAVYQERADLMGPTPVHWRSIPREKPEIDPYRQRFEYDRSTAWNNSVPQWIQFNGMRAQKIAFDAVYGNGERITCYILFPDRARYAPPYPVVIGSSRIVRGDEGTPRLQGDLMAYYQAILRGGRAVVLPTLFSHSFDRRSVEFPSMYPDPNDLDGYARRVVKMANDVSRTADFIEDYASLFGDDSLDSQNLAFVRCANLNTACWLVADKFFVNGGSSRFKAVIFPNDGIENCTLPPEVDQLTYLPWLDTPALMINSKRDLWHPYELSQTRMYDLLPLSARAKRHVAIPNYAWGFRWRTGIEKSTNGWTVGLASPGWRGRRDALPGGRCSSRPRPIVLRIGLAETDGSRLDTCSVRSGYPDEIRPKPAAWPMPTPWATLRRLVPHVLPRHARVRCCLMSRSPETGSSQRSASPVRGRSLTARWTSAVRITARRVGRKRRIPRPRGGGPARGEGQQAQ